MAVKFVNESGTYDKTVEDSSHQDKSKFSNPVAAPKDELWKGKNAINKPQESGQSNDDLNYD